MRSALHTLVACAAAWAMAGAAHADLFDTVNELRTGQCSRRAPVALRPDRTLDAAARVWSESGVLEQALDGAGYRAASSTAIQLAGTADDAAIRRLLAQRYCDALGDPLFTDIGSFQRGSRSWIVLARRFDAPDAADAEAVSEQVLALVNAARAQARRCGRRRFAATHPLALSVPLTRAAAAHAADMAERSTMEHRGADGSQVAERAARAGYRWRAVGENIAAGQQDAQTVVATWLESPSHCGNIMGPQFTEMGVAFAVDMASRAGIYWAQVFAAPLR